MAIVAAIETAVNADIRNIQWGIHLNRPAEPLNGQLRGLLCHFFEEVLCGGTQQNQKPLKGIFAGRNRKLTADILRANLNHPVRPDLPIIVEIFLGQNGLKLRHIHANHYTAITFQKILRHHAKNRSEGWRPGRRCSWRAVLLHRPTVLLPRPAGRRQPYEPGRRPSQ